LVDVLVVAGKIREEEREVVLESIKEREQTMSTGIGFGIAIPHASSDIVEEVVAAFGRSTIGIEFDSLDGQPVFFIVLFVVPKDQFQTHLRTLAAIAKFLNDKAVRDELSRADDAGQILRVFESRSPRS
jgi:mannitol/fructose-specific phosphotransferase system IIA component (Ntr-type)